MEHGIVIDPSRYGEITGTKDVEGTIRALYKQNEYNIAYIFTAGGYDFPVMPAQNIEMEKEERMIVVHNYHRMKDVVAQDLQIETMPSVPDYTTDPASHHSLAEAKIYIGDEADLCAFIEYLNMAIDGNDKNIPVGLKDLDIILQNDIELTSALPTINVPFAGNFHGDGYHIDLGSFGSSFLGDKLTGNVYNLGLVGGTIAGASTPAGTIINNDHIVNSYEYADNNDFTYGKLTYDLSHHFTPIATGYVEGRYANGDYQYATTDRVWSLRTGAPNYGNVDTHHDQKHTHDAARWKDIDGDGIADTNVPLYDGTVTVADRQETVGVNIVTYKGLPANYANDYLFFGQHLDKENADAYPYPVHINPVANGDADASKGGNRVYMTAGYHQSKTNDGFFYNRDAWALQPTLTAIDYSNMTVEGDKASTLPAKFTVDGNADYDSDGDSGNGVTYSNANYGHVTQNLLVYNAGEDIFLEKDEYDIPEEDVVYHNLVKSGSPAAFSTNYFHLVDRQDFNAPIAFNVNERAWYERLPMNYRNVTTYGYDSGSAWEGIVLPFTATKVTAEKNGEISHFYGDSDLHHEYWLRGFKSLADNKATFARPAVSGDGYFTDRPQSGTSYDYPANGYFTSLFSYDNHVDTREDEYDDTMGNHDQAWYAQPHNFADYVPLTAAVPYIVAFPGDDFYEFSMESEYKTDAYGREDYRQMATFESGVTTIGVTDDNVVSTTVSDYTHNGTFLHRANEYGINAAGTAFEANKAILPFRTYMEANPSSPAPQTRSILIWEGAQPDADEPENAEDEMGEDCIIVYSADGNLVVESTYDVRLPLTTVAGQFVRYVNVRAGKNIYHNLQKGVYVINGQKVIL